MTPEVERLMNMATVGRGDGRVIVDDVGMFKKQLKGRPEWLGSINLKKSLIPYKRINVMKFYAVREIDDFKSLQYRILEQLSSGPKSTPDLVKSTGSSMPSVGKTLHRLVHRYRAVQVCGFSSARGYLYKLSPLHRAVNATKPTGD